MSAENKVNDPDSLLKKAMLQLKTSGIPISERIDPHVRINNRAKKRFGMCIMKNGSYTIELSSIMLTEPESSCMQTLCHELIHTCRGCGDHGSIFKKYADILNRRYGYNGRSEKRDTENSKIYIEVQQMRSRDSAEPIFKCYSDAVALQVPLRRKSDKNKIGWRVHWIKLILITAV